MLKYLSKSWKKRTELVVASVLLLSQLIMPFVAAQPVYAANTIVVSDHEGQLDPSGAYSNGNITEYAELESINYRFTVDSSSNGNGQMTIKFSEDDGNCVFFDGSLVLGTHDGSAPVVVANTGVAPNVTLVGSPVVVAGDWVQTIDVDFSAGAGNATIYYYLTLTDEAGNCTGSSQYSRTGNAAKPGEFSDIGANNVPIPAKDIIELSQITVTKLLDTDGDGQSDRPATAGEWSFSLDGGTPIPTDSNGQVVFSNLSTGAFTVTESNGLNDYSVTSVTGTNCVQQGNEGVANVEATSNNPVEARCTFLSSRDLANTTVTLIKEAINDSGGDCDGQGNIALLPGQDVVCTITNDDVAPTLTLFKEVINDDGGDLEMLDFAATLDDDKVEWGETLELVANIEYSAGEIEVEGYEASSWTGDCNADGTITMAPGQSAECVIVNDDIAPTLTLEKTVINDGGGELGADDFTAYIDGNSAEWGLQIPLAANVEYTVSEDDAFGYDAGDWSGDCNDDGTITLTAGEDAVCTITNDDIPPTIRIAKDALPNSEQAFEFELRSSYNNLTVETVELIDDGQSDTSYFETNELGAGIITIREIALDGWDLADIDCDIETELDEGALEVSFEIGVGEEVECLFTNLERADITVTKFHDIDQDGFFDQSETEIEETLSGWNINLHKANLNRPNTSDEQPRLQSRSAPAIQIIDSQVTGEDGTTTFTHLPIDRGQLYAVSETLQEGWNQSNIYCEYSFNDFAEELSARFNQPDEYDDSVHPDYVPVFTYPGAEINCYVGNYRDAVLDLAKLNNRPQPTVNGDIVTYTLIASVPEDGGCVFSGSQPLDFREIEYHQRSIHCDADGPERTVSPNIALSIPVEPIDTKPVTVTDLPPEGFTYIPDSWTASSNVRGDLKASGITTEPTYASPGVWNLTNTASNFMVPGEVVVLSYQAVISAQPDQGVHPDTAFAQAYSALSDPIYSNVHRVNTPFVATDVEIALEDTIEEGVVLGVTTLAQTGSNITFVAPLVGSVLAVTALLPVLADGKSKRRVLRVLQNAFSHSGSLLLALALTLSIFGSSSALAQGFNEWELQAFEPATTTRSGSLDFNYQILSINENDSFKVEAMIDGVSVDTQRITAPFGDSGSFDLDFPSTGEFKLQIKAVSSQLANTMMSEAFVVTYDDSAPDAPLLGSKTRNGVNTTIRFTVPDGSDAQTIAVFASTQTSFTANQGTLVGEVEATPGSEQSFTYNASTNREYFFAVQSVDAAGNRSQLSAENVVVVSDDTTVLSSSRTSEGQTVTGAATSGQIAGDNDLTGDTNGDGVVDENDPTEDTNGDGVIDGNDEVTNTQPSDGGEVLSEEDNTSESSSNLIWLLVGGGSLAGLYYLYRSRQETE